MKAVRTSGLQIQKSQCNYYNINNAFPPFQAPQTPQDCPPAPNPPKPRNLFHRREKLQVLQVRDQVLSGVGKAQTWGEQRGGNA
ncbi:hypothetical protein FGO68_gene4488 [Halteria grandinella]|uniref:Uncharacterized protein n=1 Tax=Halteria grandinella TaxID=5974 RepID=A0A8J8NX12_HALGN|nr:hypothetical protein FGO68_gene4488 [Halteria grandinella]